MKDLIIITHVEALPFVHVRVTFDDGIVKIFDIGKLVRDSVFEETFKNISFFHALKIYENGGGIYWPNQFDLCAEALRYHTEGTIEQPAINPLKYSKENTMSKSAIIEFSVDAKLKKDVERILRKQGLTFSDAIDFFFNEFRQGRLPFDPSRANDNLSSFSRSEEV